MIADSEHGIRGQLHYIIDINHIYLHNNISAHVIYYVTSCSIYKTIVIVNNINT